MKSFRADSAAIFFRSLVCNTLLSHSPTHHMPVGSVTVHTRAEEGDDHEGRCVYYKTTQQRTSFVFI